MGETKEISHMLLHTYTTRPVACIVANIEFANNVVFVYMKLLIYKTMQHDNITQLILYTHIIWGLLW